MLSGKTDIFHFYSKLFCEFIGDYRQTQYVAWEKNKYRKSQPMSVTIEDFLRSVLTLIVLK